MLSGLRNFFIVFLISLAVFGLSANFLMGYIENIFNPEEVPPATNEAGEPIPNETSGSSEIETNEFYRLRIMFIGIDNGDSQDPHIEEEEDKRKEADTIILADINARSKTFKLSYLPRDMKVDVKGYRLRLGAVYAEHGAEMLIRTVKSYTGVQPDFYCVLDYAGIEELFNVLGEIEYNVPMKMYYMPEPYAYDDEGKAIKGYAAASGKTVKSGESKEEDAEEQKPEIDLKKGMQMIDGEKAVQLLRFRNYGDNYLTEEAGRIELHKDFIKELIRQKFTLENLGRAQEIYNAVAECIIETNVQKEDFQNYTNLLFGFSEFELKLLEYPGDRQYQNGIEFFIPNYEGAIRFYSEYR